MAFYQQGWKDGKFDSGIERALERILADPEFVFRRRPSRPILPSARPIGSAIWSWRRGCPSSSGAAFPTTVDHAGQREQAARSGDSGTAGQRMLADPRSDQLVINFAGQWLNLRAMQTVVPDPGTVSRIGTTTCGSPCARKPSCSSAAWSTKIAACWIFWMEITPSLMSGWRSTTGFPASTEATSAAWSCRPSSITGVDCWVRVRSRRFRPTPTARRPPCAGKT